LAAAPERILQDGSEILYATKFTAFALWDSGRKGREIHADI